jgi:uncharacterized protein (TIGR02996 family)
MNCHQAFLRKILEDPADDGPRLVYADWLEDHGEIDRADFIRTECKLAALPRGDKRRRPLKAHLETLDVDEQWVAAVSKASLENCEFEFRCPARWDRLQPTSERAIRVCEACQEHVYYCNSIEEARSHAFRGRCVAIAPGVERAPDDLARRLGLTMGRIAPRSTRGPGRRVTILHRPASRSQP